MRLLFVAEPLLMVVRCVGGAGAAVVAQPRDADAADQRDKGAANDDDQQRRVGGLADCLRNAQKHQGIKYLSYSIYLFNYPTSYLDA